MGIDEAKKVAGRYYQPGVKKEQDEVNQGLKETHEQVANFYMEGTVDEYVMRDKKGKDQEEQPFP